MASEIIKREELKSIVFIRAVCTLGIVIFHFCFDANSKLQSLRTFANGYIGEILVTVFFMVSGAVLYYNHPFVPSVKTFYKKRWLSIFPAFYLAFFCFYFINVISSKCLFYEPGVAPWKLVFTLIGMDGYLLDTNLALFKPNWYILGEWFLGAIILLYLLYPILCRFCKEKAGTIGTAAFVMALFLFQAFTDFFLIKGFRSLWGCLFSFLCGMLFIKYRSNLSNRFTIIISAILFLVALIIKLPLPSTIPTHVCGIALFILLERMGNPIMNLHLCGSFCRYIARIGFPIFLVQHKLIAYIQSVWNPNHLLKSAFVLIATILIILVFSQILQASVKALTKSALVKKSNV